MTKKFTVTGTATRRKDGSFIFENLVLNPVEVKKIQPPRTLKEAWNHDAGLNFQTFRSELTRHGVLSGNDLKLTARQVRACYKFLESAGILPAMGMTEVYACFAGSFKLKFSGARSLQSIPDHDGDQDFWKGLFSFFVSLTNEISDNNLPERITDI